MRDVDFSELADLAGHEMGVSEWFLVDQERVNKFADATGDYQWIHVDVERAEQEMGGPIAHGYLTLSLIPMLTQEILKVEGVTRGINYGSNKIRFSSMVPVGSGVRARQKIVEVTPRAGGLQLIQEIIIEVEGQQKPACVAETIALVFGG